MAAEWRGTLADLAREGVLAFGDGYRTKQPELGRPGFPILRVAQIADGFIEMGGIEDCVRDEFRSAIGPKLSQVDDVVLTTKGTFGRRAIVRSGAAGLVYSPQVCFFRVVDRTRLHPPYLYYWLGSDAFLAQAVGLKSQTDMADYLSLRDLARIRLTLPEVAQQRRIAGILGALDDKIELNRRMSETLESMARALFKSWFVDFDPVRAKSEGRDPGLPPHLARLFPDSFEDSEIGNIPRGWRASPICELATIVGGTTPRTSDAKFWEGGGHYWATPKDLSSLVTPVLLETERRVTDAGLARIGSGLLPPGTVLLSSRAPIGYLAIAEVPLAINQGFIAMRPAPGVSNLFLLHWAESAQGEIVSRANGSTFLEISKAGFRPILVAAPTNSVYEAFDQIARPAYSRVVVNERETRALIRLRDQLLPKLISGEVRVRESEHSPAGASR